jgi:hypothetical protein
MTNAGEQEGPSTSVTHRRDYPTLALWLRGVGSRHWWVLSRLFHEARRAVAGATAALPDSGGTRIPVTLARQMAGKTPAQIRGELGHEMPYQRQRSKTRPTSYDRAEALERILTWLHVTGAATYDPAAHAAADPAASGSPN